jgi:hypothetical protein
MSTFIEIIATKTGYDYENHVCNFCKNVFSLDSKNQFKKINSAFQIEVRD